MYIYIRIYIYIHTYIHTYIHICLYIGNHRETDPIFQIAKFWPIQPDMSQKK